MGCIIELILSLSRNSCNSIKFPCKLKRNKKICSIIIFFYGYILLEMFAIFIVENLKFIPYQISIDIV